MHQIALSTSLTRSYNLDRIVVLKRRIPLLFRIEAYSKPRLFVLAQHRVVVRACLGGKRMCWIDRIVNRFWHLVARRWRSFIDELVL